MIADPRPQASPHSTAARVCFRVRATRLQAKAPNAFESCPAGPTQILPIKSGVKRHATQVTARVRWPLIGDSAAESYAAGELAG